MRLKHENINMSGQDDYGQQQQQRSRISVFGGHRQKKIQRFEGWNFKKL